MTVYSTQFAAGTQTMPNEPIYTVPAGTVIVVRSIDTHSHTGDAHANLGNTANPSLLGVGQVTAGDSTFYCQWRGYQVFNAGEVLHFDSNAGDADYIVSGYLLYTL